MILAMLVSAASLRTDMSPEVIMAEGAGYDGSACDVWSMGVMLYVMVVW